MFFRFHNFLYFCSLKLYPMKKIAFVLWIVSQIVAVQAQKSVYDFKVKDAAGKEVSLSQYAGKALLIVNTATECGFTPQYAGLEALYEKYRAQGFEVLDFPCNQFGGQAPGTMDDIQAFCTAEFNTQFPLFEKIDVNGPDAAPLYVFLKSKKGFAGFDLNDRLGKLLDEMMRKQDPKYAKSPDIKWNFTKFLVDKKGRVVKRYEPTAKMDVIEADVEKLLKK